MKTTRSRTIPALLSLLLLSAAHAQTGTVVVNGNRIAVNVAELLPRPPDMR